MNVLGISGSPRKGGNSDLLLDAALKGAKAGGARVKKIFLNDLKFRPCQHCGGCDRTGKCVLRDDLRRVYREFEKADGIMIASPIFFGSLSAQVKMMIDRFQSEWVFKYVLKRKRRHGMRRKGLFLCVGGAKTRRFFENAREIIKIFFTVLDVTYESELFVPGVDKKAEIRKRRGAFKKAFQLGKALAGGQ